MTNKELVAKLQGIVDNYKTVYMLGCFGAPVSEKLISGKAKQLPAWYTSQKQAELRKLIGKGYFAFDCVNLIKGLLWGWNGDLNATYGGAKYASNGVPDTNADGMIKLCKDVSTNFSNIESGEAVWMSGHIGIYIGGGKVIECTPLWENKVQVTDLKVRRWVKHGKLPYITYVKEDAMSLATIKKGTTNKEATKTLQTKLNALGYNCGAVDGIFGANTDKQVRLYQKDNGLVVDGIVGAKTWDMLLSEQEKSEPLKYQKIRRYSSYVHVVEMNPKEYRLDITEGIPGKYERPSTVFGEPRLDEIVWVRMNAQFCGGTSTRGYGSFIDPTDNLPDKPSMAGYTDLTYKDGKLRIGTGGDFTIGSSYGLIQDGKTNHIFKDWWGAIMAARHPRSMAGSLKNGNNAFIVVDGRWTNLSLGMTAQQQTELGHELGFVNLVNFDGGGSSVLVIGDKIMNRPSDGSERAVISCIVAYRKYALDELPVIKKGSKGVYVNLLQRLLNASGCECGAADGIFGNGTLTAVKKYQKQHGLVVDGIVGKLTWAKLTEGRK